MTRKVKLTEREVDILFSEYERVASDIRAYEATNEKVVGISLTIIGAFFAYGIKEKIDAILALTPVLLLSILFFALIQYRNIYWCGGYKRALEVVINSHLGKDILFWELIINEKRSKKNPMNIALATAIYLIILSVSAYVFLFVAREHSNNFIFLYMVIVISMTFILIQSIFYTLRCYSVSFTESMDIFKSKGVYGHIGET